jgi:hypothetical protein
MAYDDYLAHRKSLIDLSAVVRQYSDRLVPRLPRSSVDDFAGSLRDTLPAFINELGAVAGSLGVNYYSTLRAKSKVAGTFIPKIAPFDTSAATNTAVSFLAKSFVEKNGSLGTLQTNLGDELQRSVVGIERDTIFSNATRDSGVTLYQRVAAADSCEFCSMVAFDPNLTKEYPTEYHRNCFCTVEPVFRGQDAIRPSYYNEFENQYDQAVGQLDPLDRSTANILSKVREIRTGEDVAANLRAAGQ